MSSTEVNRLIYSRSQACSELPWRARVRNGASWSPLVEEAYYPAQDFSGLRVTELMYHPPPSGPVSGEEFEFLELKNTGPNIIDLGGASFAGITFTFTNGTLIAPGAFVVLGRSATNFAARYPGVTLNGIYTSKLDNSGEKIALATALGVEILSLTYDDDSPWTAVPDGYGFSLVATDLNGAADPNDSRLWRASSNPGGSPGTDDPPMTIPSVLINEILAHTDPPESDAIELFNPATNSVDLSGWFLTDDSGNPFKFRIPNGTSIAAESYLCFTEADFNSGGSGFVFSSTGESACLYSGTAVGTNLTGYSHSLNFGASANGVSFGHYVNSVGEEEFPAQISNTFGSTNSGPRVGPVVISEIHYHPLTNDDEFVELLNITNVPVLLFDPGHPTNSWRVNGLNFAFPTGVTLPAGGPALVVATNPDLFRAKYNVPTNVPVLGPFGGVLQNDGERLELQRPDAPNADGSVPYITVDEVRYHDRAPWPVEADGDGASLQRLFPTAYGNDPANWFAGHFNPGDMSTFNLPPAVSLTDPTNGAAYILPAPITLTAAAEDADGNIARVDFFNGTTKLGEVTNSPFTFIWQLVVPGTYLLTAKAYDNESASNFSSEVTITVIPPAPELQISQASSDVILAFTAQASVNYTVESRTNLVGGRWLPFLELPASETLTNHIIAIPAMNAETRFFRVVVPGPF